MRIIQTDKLTKKFNSFTAVDKVTMDVEEGEVYGLLGPNGAGKSTLIRMLTTLSVPSEGTAKVAGYDIRRDPDKVRQAVGMVSEKMIMYERLTAYENLRLFSKLYNVPKRDMEERIADLLKIVNMTKWADTQIGKFSTGMKQRINVIRALVSMPRIVFMDEPTLGLDPQSTTEIRKLIKKLNDEQGLTIVLTTHIMNEADVLCDRIGLIDKGNIAAVGSPNDLKSMITERGNTIVDLDLIDPPANAWEMFRDLKIVKSASQTENMVKVIVSREDAFQEIVTASTGLGLRLRNANINQPSLEDVFLHFTGRAMVDEVKGKVSSGMKHGPFRRSAGRGR
ncbi:MAG: ATP-binding cassette domain-containing protein [Candidatus Thermoplasmatota archaeon]|nr:ATP-binding cassette domain-containing protein [Candidatus Thermoplasmatota archaeon]